MYLDSVNAYIAGFATPIIDHTAHAMAGDRERASPFHWQTTAAPRWRGRDAAKLLRSGRMSVQAGRSQNARRDGLAHGRGRWRVTAISRILVVDDEQSCQELARFALSERGWEEIALEPRA